MKKHLQMLSNSFKKLNLSLLGKFLVTNKNLDGEKDNDTKRVIKLGYRVIFIGFGGFILWASLIPLDEGVPTSGTVSVDTKRKAIQHLSGGTISEVLVHEGEWVNKGQLLIKLSDLVQKTNYENAKQSYLTIKATHNRLASEQLNLNEINFDEDLLKIINENGTTEGISIINTQKQLFSSRKKNLQANLSSLEEAINGQKALVEGYQKISQSRKKQYDLVKDELDRSSVLIKEGYLPLNRQFELERSMAEFSASNADAMSNLSKTQQNILDLKQKIIALKTEYSKEVEQQLVEAKRDLPASEERYKATRKEFENTKIVSPVEGQVIGLAFQTIGGIIEPGQKIMEIVPKSEKLTLETKVQPHLIDRIGVNDRVDVRFSSFSHSPILVVEGKVVTISADAIQSNNQEPPYYLARVTLTEKGFKSLGNRQLQPGMPVEVIIKTGNRTLLQYLLHPLVKRLAASLKEE
jgi:protease secretion system membrane fusion protein